MDIICPKTRGPCRHCSDECRKTVTRTGDSVTGIRRTVDVQNLGAFCNNDCRSFVRDLAACPAVTALAAPLVPYEISPLDWMRRRS